MTDAPWPLPLDWHWSTFSNVARVASDLVDPALYPDAPHIAPNHIESASGRLLPFRTIAADGVTSPKHRFSAGQVLYSKIRPYLAKVIVAGFDGLCSADMYPIATNLDPRFLKWWMLTPEFTRRAAGQQARTVLPKINRRALDKLPVPVPPEGVQRRLADIVEDHMSRLEAATHAVTQCISRIALLERAIIDDVFVRRADEEGWPVVSLGDIASSERRSITDGPFGSNLTSAHYTDAGARVVRLQNIGDGVFREADAFISLDHYRSLIAHDVRPGDLVLASLGDQLPRAAVVPDLGGPAIVKADCIRIRPRPDVDPMWAVYACRSSRAKRWAAAHVHGVGRQRLGMKGIKDIPLPLPESSTLRDEVVRSLTAQSYELSRLRSELSVIATRREVLQRSLLSAAFSGRLTGRVGDMNQVEEMAGV
ncbi:restriction endonuclease subunit S [Micromonospora globispora]|uniref:restriction endonuclease subunit S n=1 Tax=Micromonospora globispora TaxID=1450148 RepID=UPI000F5E339D|nr:restriction endonuclease subunit S [Micromonospora globispora]